MRKNNIQLLAGLSALDAYGFIYSLTSHDAIFVRLIDPAFLLVTLPIGWYANAHMDSLGPRRSTRGSRPRARLSLFLSYAIFAAGAVIAQATFAAGGERGQYAVSCALQFGMGPLIGFVAGSVWRGDRDDSETAPTP